MFRDTDTSLSKFLGWFSIGLGLFEIFAGRSLARTLGVPKDGILLRAYGVREAGVGAAILNDPEQPAYIWARVAGDAMDLATLALALRPPNNRRDNVEIAMAAVAGITALDVICAARLSRS